MLSVITTEALESWGIQLHAESEEHYRNADLDCWVRLTSPESVNTGQAGAIPARTIIVPIPGGEVRKSLSLMLAGGAPTPTRDQVAADLRDIDWKGKDRPARCGRCGERDGDPCDALNTLPAADERGLEQLAEVGCRQAALKIERQNDGPVA